MRSEISRPSLTRREFLKLAAAAAAGTVLFGPGGCSLKRDEGSLFPRYTDLMAHFSEAVVQTPDPIYVKAGELVHVAGDGRFSLFAHPPSQVTFPKVSLFQNGRFKFGIGIHQDAWTGTDDGVRFIVQVVDQAGRSHDVYDRHLDPRNRPEDRRWFDETVDLGRFAGQQVQVVLRTEAGANNQNDWAAWSAPHLLSWEQADGQTSERPNILLITLDTLRGDHVSAYGYPRRTTPALDRLAAEGILFTRAYSHSERTNPSHLSILTGLYPRTHGVGSNRIAVPAEVVTVQERLQELGYHTVGAVSAFHMGPVLHMDRGFADFYPCEQGRQGAETTTQSVLSWLNEHRQEPFFMWVHYFDPHAPYLPPYPYNILYDAAPPYAPYRLSMADTEISPELIEHYLDWPPPIEDIAEIITQYDGAVAYSDVHVAMLLDWLDKSGLADRTIVIATSDHGEGFGEHGVAFDHFGVHKEMVHVPLILRYPGRLAPGRIVEDLVGHVDLGPALFELLGLSVPPEMQGTSLLPLLEGRRWRGPEGVVSQMHDDYALAVRTADWSMILQRKDNTEWPLYPLRAGTGELYNLEADPGEQSNLLPPASSTGRKAQQALSELVLDWEKQVPPGAAGEAAPLDEETEEMLRRLGY